MLYPITSQAFGADISAFPNVAAWYDRMKQLEGYDDINQKGANIFREMFRSKLS
jgi:glutathione S-transferase